MTIHARVRTNGALMLALLQIPHVTHLALVDELANWLLRRS
jgi:hypothetical protein